METQSPDGEGAAGQPRPPATWWRVLIIPARQFVPFLPFHNSPFPLGEGFLLGHLPCFQRLEETPSRAGRFLWSVCHDFGDLRQASRRLWLAFCNSQFASRTLREDCGNPKETSRTLWTIPAIRKKGRGRSGGFRQSAEGEEDAPERFFVASQNVQDALGRLLEIPTNVQDAPERRSGLPRLLVDASRRRCEAPADEPDVRAARRMCIPTNPTTHSGAKRPVG